MAAKNAENAEQLAAGVTEVISVTRKVNTSGCEDWRDPLMWNDLRFQPQCLLPSLGPLLSAVLVLHRARPPDQPTWPFQRFL